MQTWSMYFNNVVSWNCSSLDDLIAFAFARQTINQNCLLSKFTEVEVTSILHKMYQTSYIFCPEIVIEVTLSWVAAILFLGS